MIDTSLPRTVMIGSDAIVVIDRGQKDGVQAGNRFFVVRSGENVDEPLPENPSAFPREVIAEILVLEPNKRTSIGFVTRARREFAIGDRLQMRLGY